MLVLLYLVLVTSWAEVLSAGPLAERSSNAARCKDYTIQDGDTCFKVGKKNKATYAQIVSWNRDVPSLCSKMKSLKGSTICVSNPSGDFSIPTNTKADPSIATTAVPIPTKVPDATNKNCGEYAVVKEGEDCANILADAGITMDDFMVLNPQVWENCTNLWLDYSYCVKPVGFITTYPGYGGTAAPSTTTTPFKKVESTDVPLDNNQTDPSDGFEPAIDPIPLAKGTRLDCENYFWIENTTDSLVADCWSLASAADIEPEQLVLWNPSLANNNNTSETPDDPGPLSGAEMDSMTFQNEFAYPCTISSSQSYCIGLSPATTSANVNKGIETPTPRAAEEIGNCTMWFRMSANLACDDLLLTYYLRFSEFYKMNPSVGEDCSGLVVGTYYCRSTYPGGEGAGIPGWSSSELEDDFPPPTSTQWTSGASTKTSTNTGDKTSITSTRPSPVQIGVLESCTEFHKVEKGDTCYDIANVNKITLSTFYNWNPAVGKDCSALELGTYVCIGSS